MLVFLFILQHLFMVLGENCYNKGINLYNDLGCVPHYENSSACPTSYYCKGLEQSNDYCMFNGRKYAIDERVENSSESCNVGCFCSGLSNPPQFVCAILDCPEWLGVRPGPGCYNTYSLDACCSTGKICNFNNNAICMFDKTKYKIGQRFHIDSKCLVCICNYTTPSCRRVSCGTQLHYSNEIQKHCAPLYVKTYCCPVGWVCETGTEIVSESNNISVTSDLKIYAKWRPGKFCLYGTKTILVGQSFTTTHELYGRADTVYCVCRIPPLMICYRDNY